MAVTFTFKDHESPLSNKAGLNVYDIAYSTNIIGNRTAYILRPKIDKISITYAINDEVAQKGIGSLLTNVVLDQDTPYFQNAYFKKGKAGGYAHSVHLRHPETKQNILIQAAPHYKKSKRPAFPTLPPIF